MQGELVDNLAEQPLFQSTILAWGKWLLDAAFEPKLQSLMTAKSELTGEEVHIFWHMPSDTAGLLQNFDAAIKLAERIPITGYTSIARDELADLLSVLPEVDRKYETDYTGRLKEYPAQFSAPPVYRLRRHHRRQGRPEFAPLAAVRPRSLPAHRRAARGRHRRARREGPHLRLRGGRTSSWSSRSVRCGHGERRLRRRRSRTPVDTPGIKLVCRGFPGARTRTSSRPRCRSHDDAVMESFTIFDDVFVPWERVFPVRRGGVRGRGREHVREREPPGL